MTNDTKNRQFDIHSRMGLAGKISQSKNKFLTNEEWEELGVKRFKRKLLGLCGSRAVKTFDEISDALVDIGAAISREEAEQIIPELQECSLFYSSNKLCFSLVTNICGKKNYLVSVIDAKY